MSQDRRDLQTILASQAKRQQSYNISTQVINEIKGSLIAHVSWERLPQAAPTAICLAAACCVASSSPKAELELSPPRGEGFQHLGHESLRANLIGCSDMGRMAFLEVEDKMNTIHLTMQVVNKKINDIVSVVFDPPSSMQMLQLQFQDLLRRAQICLDNSISMDKAFTGWLLFACELYTACVQQESSTRDTALSSELCLAAETTRLDHRRSTGEEAKKSQELFEKQVAVTSDAFRRISDEFPTGWDIMGEKVVGDAVGAVTGAFNSAIHTLMTSLNPTVKLSSGTDPVPKGAADPAYTEIQKIFTFLSTLQVIVAGQKDGGINWEMAKSSVSSKSGKISTIKFVVTMLDYFDQRFAPMATSEDPSLTLREILKVSLYVAKGLQAEVERSGNNYPAEDSIEVNKWQADFATQYAQANALLATAKTIPGMAANGIPLMSLSSGSTQDGAQITATSVQEQAVLEAAKGAQATSSQMLTVARDSYVKSSDVLSQQQNKLSDIQTTLSNLTASNISMAEIKHILVECIKLIIELQGQITNLVRFFKAICPILESCIKSQVEPFVDTMKAIVYGNDDPNKAYPVGSYTLADLQRDQICSTTLTLRSYFSVFGDIAKMWITLSKENVLPGLGLGDEIANLRQEQSLGVIAPKMRKLSQWSQEATARVKRAASDKQREILDEMQTRINVSEDMTRSISAPSSSTVKAIEAGIHVTKEAAQNSIEQRFKASALARFATTG